MRRALNVKLATACVRARAMDLAYIRVASVTEIFELCFLEIITAATDRPRPTEANFGLSFSLKNTQQAALFSCSV